MFYVSVSGTLLLQKHYKTFLVVLIDQKYLILSINFNLQ